MCDTEALHIMLCRLWLVGAASQLRLWSRLLQENSCRIIRVYISAEETSNKWETWQNTFKIEKMLKQQMDSKMILTHVSSSHQQESELLVKDPFEPLLSRPAGYIVSLNQLGWKTKVQKFHNRLPWTRFWMSE